MRRSEPRSTLRRRGRRIYVSPSDRKPRCTTRITRFYATVNNPRTSALPAGVALREGADPENFCEPCREHAAIMP